MNKKRRIILKTKTVERITLHSTAKQINSQILSNAVFQIEISKIKDGKKQFVFAVEIFGQIQIMEGNNEFRLTCRNK